LRITIADYVQKQWLPEDVPHLRRPNFHASLQRWTMASAFLSWSRRRMVMAQLPMSKPELFGEG